MKDKYFEKLHLKTVISISQCALASIFWRTLDFKTKLAQNYIIDKNFQKANIKIVVSMSQCNLVRDFSQFAEFQILGQNLTKKYE